MGFYAATPELTARSVDDYDEAISFYTGMLEFKLRKDKLLSTRKRSVVVGPPESGAGLLLARVSGERQRRCIGDQGGGQVSPFFETDDLARDHATYTDRGVRFTEPPDMSLTALLSC